MTAFEAPRGEPSDEGPLSARALREHGHELVDWLADHWERLEQLPTQADVEPGWVRGQLPPRPPEHGEAFADVLADLDRIIVPALTHWQHPGFFAYFPSNISTASVLGELAAAGLGIQGMQWSTSPAATELETHVLDWLAELLGLPTSLRSDGPGGGVIVDTASSATLCALLAARERAHTHERSLTVFATTEAHASIDKAARIVGAGPLARVAADTDGRMDPQALADALEEVDGDAFVMATVGTTSTGAVDPLVPVGRMCRDRGAGVWLHVDAAWAGTAAVCPEHRWLHDGLAACDSYVTNPHKWLLTNVDCSAFFVADATWLTGALSVAPEYLRNAASDTGAVIDYRNWQIPLGRRFRALKLWFVLRLIAAEGLRAHVRRHVALADDLAERVRAHPALELAAPPSLALLCVAHRNGEEATQALLDAVDAADDLFVTHTRVAGRLVVRVAVGGVSTGSAHIDRLWDVLDEAAGERRGPGSSATAR